VVFGDTEATHGEHVTRRVACVDLVLDTLHVACVPLTAPRWRREPRSGARALDCAARACP
jgi:hypothetical protein